MSITGIILLCGLIAVASLVAMIIAIAEYQNVEAVAMFFISLVCSVTPLAGRRYWSRVETVDVNLITNLGIAGGVCFIIGLFFLFYPKGKKDV